MEGMIRPGATPEEGMQIVDDVGIVLAVGHLVAHPGSQMVAGDQIASAVQFSGTLTSAGLAAAAVTS